MTLDELVKKYGTNTISLVIKELAAGKPLEWYPEVCEMAEDLQEALKGYAKGKEKAWAEAMARARAGGDAERAKR